jgi:hypothetical protein
MPIHIQKTRAKRFGHTRAAVVSCAATDADH